METKSRLVDSVMERTYGLKRACIANFWHDLHSRKIKTTLLITLTLSKKKTIKHNRIECDNKHMLDSSDPSLSISQLSINNDLLGVVIGVTNSGYVIFEGKEPVGLGEYIIITNTDKKKILGVVESCLIKSDALDDISNFQEALESKTVAEINKRDKSFKINVKILGLLNLLKQSKVI